MTLPTGIDCGCPFYCDLYKGLTCALIVKSNKQGGALIVMMQTFVFFSVHCIQNLN